MRFMFNPSVTMGSIFQLLLRTNGVLILNTFKYTPDCKVQREWKRVKN